MDPHLEEPLDKLAEALHVAIARAPEVEAALAAVRAAGFQATLLVEVTVAVSPLDAASPETPSAEATPDAAGEPSGATADAGAGEVAARFAPEDVAFLKSLRIRLDD